MLSGLIRLLKGVWKMFRPDTSMFRCRYIGDNGALQNTRGWGWTEARQLGLTFLKWYYVSDTDDNQVVWTVVAPVELEIERNWSKKKDRDIEALPINALRFATGMVKQPYDIHELRKMMNIPEPKEVVEVLDLNDLFAQHDSADQIRAERDARDLAYQAARDQAMLDIESVLGADLNEEEEQELLDLSFDVPTKVKAILSTPLPKQADEQEEFILNLWDDEPASSSKEFILDLSL